jgi:hypothetical protein
MDWDELRPQPANAITVDQRAKRLMATERIQGDFWGVGRSPRASWPSGRLTLDMAARRQIDPTRRRAP